MVASERVIFINQDSGYLMIDIINAYSAAGYKCVLITGRLVERDISLDPGTRVERIIKYNRTTAFQRLFTWIIGFMQIWIKVFCKFRKDYLFLVSNPPFLPLLPLFVKNRFRLLIFDVFPDALTGLRYINENTAIYKWWKDANRKVYARAENIFTITESMKVALQKYADSSLIKVVPVWTDNKFLKPINQDENPFVLTHNLSGKFVVLYSGNIGLSGNVDVLLNIAIKIDRDDILFVIIGEGAKKKEISEKIDQLKLTNVVLLPWQPVTELPFSLSSASLAVISLGIKSSMISIPSKLYNFLSIGAPLLCISSKGSEVENLVSKYKCGMNFEPNDIDGMTNFVVEVAGNKALHKLMQNNSLSASKDFSPANVREFLI